MFNRQTQKPKCLYAVQAGLGKTLHLIIGVVAGYFLGCSNQSPWRLTLKDGTKSVAESILTAQQQVVLTSDEKEINFLPQLNGWQSIDVFVGPTRNLTEAQKAHGHGISLRNSPIFPCGTADGTGIPHLWFSQTSQDETILSMMGATCNKRATAIYRGFFVDLASNHALHLSNTYVLEKHYDWQGLCIEANPSYWQDLSALRPRCRIIGAVVGNQSHPHEQIQFNFNGMALGGIAGAGFDNGVDIQGSSKFAYTIPLAHLLEKYHAPSVIDYFSLDVEGAEMMIMSDFPFNKYRFRILTAERPTLALQELLHQHGYRYIKNLTDVITGIDFGETIWVHKLEIPSLHFDWLGREYVEKIKSY
jgi:hypothetical protein